MTQWPNMPVPDVWAYAAWFSIVLGIVALAIGMSIVVRWTLRLRREYRNLPKTVAELRAQQQRDTYHRHFGLDLNDDEDHHDPWPKEA